LDITVDNFLCSAALDYHFYWYIIVQLHNFVGEYAFCFGNIMNRYSSKIVYFFLLSYSEADWESFTEEDDQFLGEGLQNFTVSCLFCL